MPFFNARNQFEVLDNQELPTTWHSALHDRDLSVCLNIALGRLGTLWAPSFHQRLSGSGLKVASYLIGHLEGRCMGICGVWGGGAFPPSLGEEWVPYSSLSERGFASLPD